MVLSASYSSFLAPTGFCPEFWFWRQRFILDLITIHVPVVELSFRKGRVQTVIMRELRTRNFAARAYEAFFSGSKGHFNIRSFGPV